MPADFIYLSPHLDDAALSCGGQIAQQTRYGRRALVATVCAGGAPARLTGSAFVRELHVRWALDDPIAARRAEDLAALRTLHAEVLHLDIPDCIYRLDPAGQPLYPNRDAIFGTLSVHEANLVDRVTRQLKRLEPLWGAAVYVPLGVGRHVDHQLVRLAAERWRAPEGRLIYYEDYPYAEDGTSIEAALAGESLASRLVWLERVDLECQVAAVANYRSQLSTFFESKEEMAQRLEAFALKRANGAGLAERVWLAPGAVEGT
jgi:LmbE family N-acetylglucosaminyl deacetylase